MENHNHFYKMRSEDDSPRSVSPQQQLWELTEESQHRIFRQVLRRLKKRDQEDLCYGMIAYLRFGIKRPFESLFMQVLFESFIDLVEGKININVKPLKQ